MSASKSWIDEAAPILAEELGGSTARRVLRRLAALDTANQGTRKALDGLSDGLPAGGPTGSLAPAASDAGTPRSLLDVLRQASTDVQAAEIRLESLGLPSVAVEFETFRAKVDGYISGQV